MDFEFIVEGPPVSMQTRNRANLQAWKEKIRNAARESLMEQTPVTTRNLRCIITYFYDGIELDVDNMIKPIQDAIQGIVYLDDGQITDTRSRKKNLNGSFRINGISKVLAEGFVKGKEFIHIKVEQDTNQEDLT